LVIYKIFMDKKNKKSKEEQEKNEKAEDSELVEPTNKEPARNASPARQSDDSHSDGHSDAGGEKSEEPKKTAGGEPVESIVSKEEEYLNNWKRAMADFENYKKRQIESQKDLLRYSLEGITMQILPVLDNFHASTDHIPEDQKDNQWVVGIMHIQKQLEDLLKNNEIEEIQTKEGDEFDPKIHEAIKNDQKGEKDEPELKNKIEKVLQKGYKIGGKVIRPTRVVVE